ncbi:MAG TPA: hypothetical protein VMV31_01975 [Terriglobales bacterium]|nr:hypothetical protein [Terriglobales bacterium]
MVHTVFSSLIVAQSPNWVLGAPVRSLSRRFCQQAKQRDPREAPNLRNGEAAVRAAIQSPWSQGPVEGAVHRLKLIRRPIYGRGKLDLLRIRVLRAK